VLRVRLDGFKKNHKIFGCLKLCLKVSFISSITMAIFTLCIPMYSYECRTCVAIDPYPAIAKQKAELIAFSDASVYPLQTQARQLVPKSNANALIDTSGVPNAMAVSVVVIN
jgi:hypothetical protein